MTSLNSTSSSTEQAASLRGGSMEPSNLYKDNENIMKMNQWYIWWFEQNRNSWIPEMLKLTHDVKDSLPAIQLFFNSPNECFGGVFKIEYLTRSDIKTMYPHLLDITESLVKSNSQIKDTTVASICNTHRFLLIITVNNELREGNCLSMNTIL
jgi:hypothetical protein